MTRVRRPTPPGGCATAVIMLTVALATGPLSGRTAWAQSTDTIATAPTRTPQGALWRSAVLPGWGQVYNGQGIKAPIIAAAIGGLVYAVVTLDSDYRLYRRAYLYKVYQERLEQGAIETNPHSDYLPSYQEIESSLGQVRSSPLRTRRDALRRNRDLSILGIGVVWALATLDAYVNAHLLDFDVGENLSVRVVPSATPDGSPAASGALVWRPGR